MNFYEIVSDVPPPPARTNRVYEFHRLEVGDSFLVPTEEATRVRWALKQYRRQHAKDTSWRTKRTSKGVRIWRVE